MSQADDSVMEITAEDAAAGRASSTDAAASADTGGKRARSEDGVPRVLVNSSAAGHSKQVEQGCCAPKSKRQQRDDDIPRVLVKNRPPDMDEPQEGGQDGEFVDETCWMCLYQTDDEAKRLMEFIVRSVGYIDMFNIASQVSAFIQTRYQNVQDADGNVVELKGATPENIERHIRKHILHPKVRIAVIIKELLQFQDHLHKNLVVEDAATGLSAVDKGNVELYLKVIAQITALYKAETGTMLFGTEET